MGRHLDGGGSNIMINCQGHLEDSPEIRAPAFGESSVMHRPATVVSTRADVNVQAMGNFRVSIIVDCNCVGTL